MNDQTDQLEHEVLSRRIRPFGGGVSFLLLVALALQLPNLHLALSSEGPAREWSGLRLLAEPIIIREARLVRRQREIPAASSRAWSPIAKLHRDRLGLPCDSTVVVARLSPHLLDLPPPAAA